jgi:outer membrane immunogenic protein
MFDQPFLSKGQIPMLSPNLRIVALATGLSLCGTMNANADAYDRVSAVAPQAFSWTGFYIGGNGGGAWSNDQAVHITESIANPGLPPIETFSANFGSLSPSGGFGGVQVGANLQLGAVVLGFEADGQWASITGESAATVGYAFLGVPDPRTVTVATSSNVNRFGTLRTRMGLAWDRTLLYATGGLAWGYVGHTMSWNLGPGGFIATNQLAGTQVGYVIGGGIEHAFTPRVSLKVEYQYINLGTEHYTAQEFPVDQNLGIFKVETDARADFHTVRLGLNYKLNGP